jgi:hypothetical protein
MSVTDKLPKISTEERARRKAAVDFANANIELEGFKVSAAQQARALAYIQGDLTLEEFIVKPEDSPYYRKNAHK